MKKKLLMVSFCICISLFTYSHASMRYNQKRELKKTKAVARFSSKYTSNKEISASLLITLNALVENKEEHYKTKFSAGMFELEAKCIAAHKKKFDFQNYNIANYPAAYTLQKLNFLLENLCARTFPLQWKNIMACINDK